MYMYTFGIRLLCFPFGILFPPRSKHHISAFGVDKLYACMRVQDMSENHKALPVCTLHIVMGEDHLSE